jgi:hypothetical protein
MNMSKRKKVVSVNDDESDRAVLISAIDDDDDDPLLPVATVLSFYPTADEALARQDLGDSHRLPRLVDLRTPVTRPAVPLLLCFDQGYVLVESIAQLSSEQARLMANGMSAHWEA